jgi:hypothetical protein
MKYLVRLTARSLRDVGTIYIHVEADASQHVFAWFNRLANAIYSLERFPFRGPIIPENKRLRHLLFGKQPHGYSNYLRCG